MEVPEIKSDVLGLGVIKTSKRKVKLAPYVFVSPFYIVFFVFGLFPMVYSFYLSMVNWNGLGPMRFTGWTNFQLLFTDPQFWQAVANTFIIWFESTIPLIILAIAVAVLLNSTLVRFKAFWRVAFFLPNVTSLVTVGIVFGVLFGTQFGLVNFLLTVVGVHAIQWFNYPATTQIAVAFVIIWRWVGYDSLIFLAGLQSIPDSLYEAAMVDGASRLQTFFYVTLPLLQPVVLFTVVLSTIGGMQIFTEPQIMTNGTGGIGQGGLTIVMYLYNQAFQNHSLGYGASIAVVLFVIIVLFSVLNYFITRKLQAQGADGE